MKNILLVAIVSILISCQHHDPDKVTASLIYEKREYLLKEFKDRGISGRGKNFYVMSCYKNDSVNTFYFQKESDSLLFTRDSIQFADNNLISPDAGGITDSSRYRAAMTNELRRLLTIMDRYKIDFFTRQLDIGGIDFKFYFGNWCALLYVKDIASVKDDRWKNYLLSGEKFDENWYYVKDRQEK